MTVSLLGRCCLFGAIAGFCIGVVIQMVYLGITGEEPGRVKLIATLAGVVSCPLFMGIRDRLAMKDYRRMVADRHQRMHW